MNKKGKVCVCILGSYRRICRRLIILISCNNSTIHVCPVFVVFQYETLVAKGGNLRDMLKFTSRQQMMIASAEPSTDPSGSPFFSRTLTA
jgi:hypothetical protein